MLAAGLDVHGVEVAHGFQAVAKFHLQARLLRLAGGAADGCLAAGKNRFWVASGETQAVTEEA